MCLCLNENTDLRAFQVVFRWDVFQTPGGRYVQNILHSLQQLNYWDFGRSMTSLVDFCFETWSSDESTCICFCRGDQIISCMLQNYSAALSTNLVCCARKQKIKCACLLFFFIWEGKELSKYKSLGLLSVVFFSFFRPRLCDNMSAQNITLVLYCTAYFVCTQLQVQNGRILHQ